MDDWTLFAKVPVFFVYLGRVIAYDCRCVVDIKDGIVHMNSLAGGYGRHGSRKGWVQQWLDMIEFVILDQPPHQVAS
jgi:hypothetical protein